MFSRFFFKKAETKKLLYSGCSHREIAKKLHCSVGTVSNIRKMLTENIDSNKAGRKPKLTATTKRLIIRSIRNGTVDNTVQMKHRLITYNNINVSAETVRWILREVGMRGIFRPFWRAIQNFESYQSATSIVKCRLHANIQTRLR